MGFVRNTSKTEISAILDLLCNQVFLSERHWCLIITNKCVRRRKYGCSSIFILFASENVTLKESESNGGNRQRVS